MFVSHSFSCFNNFNQDYLHGTKNGVIRFGFYKLSEKFFLLTFLNGNKVFDFGMGIPSQKSENYDHLKR